MPVPHGRIQLPALADVARTRPHRARWRIFHPRTRTEIALAAAAAASIAALVIAGLVYSSPYLDLLFSSEPRTVDASTLRLAERSMARIIVPTDGGSCLEYTFDNDKGRFGTYRIRRCGDEPRTDLRPSLGAGFNSFKAAFGKK